MKTVELVLTEEIKKNLKYDLRTTFTADEVAQLLVELDEVKQDWLDAIDVYGLPFESEGVKIGDYQVSGDPTSPWSKIRVRFVLFMAEADFDCFVLAANNWLQEKAGKTLMVVKTL